MEPSTLNLVIYQDRDFSQAFSLKSGGVAMNLAGYHVRAEIRRNKSSSALVVAFTIAVDESAGSIILSLTSAQTLLIPRTTMFWDLVLTDSFQVRQSYMEGMILVKGTVTREE